MDPRLYAPAEPNPAPASDPANARAAADAVRDAHQLLGAYPFASATPTYPVTRHFNPIGVSASPASYTHPQYYAPSNTAYQQMRAQPYGEYENEIRYLQSTQVPPNDGGYWTQTRDEAVRYLNEQNNGAAYSQYPSPSYQWRSPSSYANNAFAHSVYQHTSPAAAYPTPPPPTISSYSALAHALVEPQPRTRPRPVHQPAQSARFFDNFLAQQTERLEVAPPVEAQNRPPAAHPAAQASGLLAAYPKKELHGTVTSIARPLPSLKPLADDLPVLSTPQKRKSEDQLNSPSVKRLQMTPSERSVVSSGSSSSSVDIAHSNSEDLSTPTGPRQAAPVKARASGPIQHRVYVELPTLKSLRTPSSVPPQTPRTAKGRTTRYDDDYEMGTDAEPASTPSLLASAKSSRHTGDRDTRGPLEKLTAVFEDLFEAEDALAPDMAPGDLPHDLFSPSTTDPSQPLLSSTVIRRISKYIDQVARPSKRMRLTSTKDIGTPRAMSRTAELDPATLARVLKMLERNVKAGEEADPLKLESAPVRPNDGETASPTKKSKGKSTPKNKGAKGVEDAADGEGERLSPAESTSQAVSEQELVDLTVGLDVARNSVLAAEACLAMLSSDRLPRQLYSEELITSCLLAVKNQLTRIIYPFMEAAPGEALPALLQHLMQRGTPVSQACQGHRSQLTELFLAVSAAFPRMQKMVDADSVAMSDAIVIQAVFIAIGPFFVVEGEPETGGKNKKDNAVLNTLGPSAIRGLRLEALSLIRSIFANHETQRSWIIEEILSSLVKLSDSKQKAGMFRLRDGRSIRTVSALLLQLVQTSAHDIHVEAQKLARSRQQHLVLRRQESMVSVNATTEDTAPDEHDEQEIRLYGSALESANKAAKTIVLFLTQRSGKTKTTKNSNEAEYRTIFDNLISDLMAVLFWPEWPAASLVLAITCRFMVSSLDDVKGGGQNDNNAAKVAALDHLGVIAARLRSCALKFGNPQDGVRRLSSLDELIDRRDEDGLDSLIAAHSDVLLQLCRQSSADQSYESARELSVATWGHEIAGTLKRVEGMLRNEDVEGSSSKSTNTKSIALKLRSALRELWKENTDIFDLGSKEDVARVEQLTEEIGSTQGLKSVFNPILNVILSALDAPPVFMRTKALRSLGQIVTSDPSILAANNVRAAIETHLLDSSPAVRDAAVELIGKYMIDSPAVAEEYYPKIADRIADTGLAVRKRVLKLLKAFYDVTDEHALRVEICSKIVLRMYDEDDSVKDLATKTIEEMWFHSPANLSPQKARRAVPDAASGERSRLLQKVATIMGVSTAFKDRQAPLEDLLGKIMADANDASPIRTRYTEICEALIDGIVDDSDLPGFTIVNCVRTIYLFSAAYPAVLSGANASILLPYLRNATTPEDRTISEYLLKIFRVTVPHMPKTALKFGQDLQADLQPLIVRPIGGVIVTLQETVACMCAVVQQLTHDYKRLVALIKSCNGRIRQMMEKPAHSMNADGLKTLSMLIIIVSLLVEHCDFDRLREEQPNLGSDLDAVTPHSVIDHVYEVLLDLYDAYQDDVFKGRVLLCLGFLFRARPTLMVADTSAAVMDAIFQSREEDARGRLLKIMQDFLFSQVAKHVEGQKGGKATKGKGKAVNMDELIGTSDGFADSGVSLAIVQRYIEPILAAVLSQSPAIQASAMDILSFTVRQGLAHPMQCFPTIVALETSPSAVLSGRASALHAILQSKHASVLNARHLQSMRESFEYQKRLSPDGTIHGYRLQPDPTALMHRWYSLVRDKRAPRQDFLRATLKAFDVRAELKSTQDDVAFVRYMAENMSAFEYKTQEEVLTVIKHLTALLSTIGMQLVDIVSPADLLAQLHGPSNNMDVDQNMPGAAPMAIASSLDDRLALMRSTVLITMMMLLKAHLKGLYGLSEEKCSKWAPGKKSAIGDKPASRKHEQPLVWDRVGFATRAMLTSEDAETQKHTFLEIWNEDGVTAEPEDEETFE